MVMRVKTRAIGARRAFANHDRVKLSRESGQDSRRRQEAFLPSLALLPQLRLVGLLLALCLGWGSAGAGTVADFIATLSPGERQQFEKWRTAQSHFERRLDAYWHEVERKRAARRPKRSKGYLYSAEDYVLTFPPEYAGPQLSDDLDRRWRRFQAAKEQAEPEKAKKAQPGLEEFLAAAEKHYGFKPTRISEREFKRRYAEESLALGLSKEQVVRVYALETGGNGTADMQAGINPVTKKGRPISSALGYAQLLHANTIGELVKSGEAFMARLRQMAAATRDPGRVQELQGKIEALRRMLHAARSVPNDWYRHVEFAQTPRGYGMHAVNLDGDIGPWLQSEKLKGLKEFAARQGIVNMSGEEIELMNLSGPATGLEMMQPTGLTMPTPNFFSRRAYYVNKMVMGKTSAELLADFTRRMDNSSRQPGAVEFAQAFDEALQGRTPLR